MKAMRSMAYWHGSKPMESANGSPGLVRLCGGHGNKHGKTAAGSGYVLSRGVEPAGSGKARLRGRIQVS